MRTVEPTLEVLQTKLKWRSNMIVLSHDLQMSLASLLLFTELPCSLKKKSFSLGQTVVPFLHGPTVVSFGRFSHFCKLKPRSHCHRAYCWLEWLKQCSLVLQTQLNHLWSQEYYADMPLRMLDFQETRCDLLYCGNSALSWSPEVRAGAWSLAGWPKLFA